MPTYRGGPSEYQRKPKCEEKWEREPEWEEDGEEGCGPDPGHRKDDCFCKVVCPFKVIVKVVPCDDHKRPM